MSKTLLKISKFYVGIWRALVQALTKPTRKQKEAYFGLLRTVVACLYLWELPVLFCCFVQKNRCRPFPLCFLLLLRTSFGLTK